MKLFVLLSRVPYPLEKGDKLRAFNHIRYLAKFYEIHLFCVNDSDLHPEAKEILSQYCRSVTIVRINKINIYLGLIRALFNGFVMETEGGSTIVKLALELVMVPTRLVMTTE